MEWITKKHNNTRHYDCDVAVTLVTNGKSKVMHLGFYDNSQLKITSTEHIIYALTADRMYFKSADSTIGLKLCQKTKKSAARIKINRRFDKWIGEYNLLFDNKEGCWYIDLNRKLR